MSTKIELNEKSVTISSPDGRHHMVVSSSEEAIQAFCDYAEEFLDEGGYSKGLEAIEADGIWHFLIFNDWSVKKNLPF